MLEIDDEFPASSKSKILTVAQENYEKSDT